jgi:hypothetical protein
MFAVVEDDAIERQRDLLEAAALTRIEVGIFLIHQTLLGNAAAAGDASCGLASSPSLTGAT